MSSTCSICTALCIYHVFVLPDSTKPFSIKSDASDTAVRGVLTQKHESVHKAIAFLRKISTRSERNYSVNNLELLAVVTCCKAWCNIDAQ